MRGGPVRGYHRPMLGPHAPLQRTDGTPFNDLRVPANIAFLAVHWRLRHPPSLHHLAGLFLEWGFSCGHETGHS